MVKPRFINIPIKTTTRFLDLLEWNSPTNANRTADGQDILKKKKNEPYIFENINKRKSRID